MLRKVEKKKRDLTLLTFISTVMWNSSHVPSPQGYKNGLWKYTETRHPAILYETSFGCILYGYKAWWAFAAHSLTQTITKKGFFWKLTRTTHDTYKCKPIHRECFLQIGAHDSQTNSSCIKHWANKVKVNEPFEALTKWEGIHLQEKTEDHIILTTTFARPIYLPN